jgi:RNA polymerase sigma-B factor
MTFDASGDWWTKTMVWETARPQTSRMAASERDTLVLEHRRLARHLARRYVRHGDQREDLEQVAYLGLVKAARRFDPGRGVAFTTFALPTVLGELRRFCRDTRWAVHVPRSIQNQVQALRRSEDELQAHCGHPPSATEVAQALGWAVEEVIDARLAARSLHAESLNATVEAEDGGVAQMLDCLGDEDGGYAAADERDELRRALARLTPHEREALRLRGAAECSTAQIAQHMGLSTSQASRLVVGATQELRAALAA